MAMVAMLGMVPAVTASAQVTCTLAAADCKMLSTADSNIPKESSFNMDFAFTTTIKSGSQTVAVKADGTGMFAVVPGASITDTTSAFNSFQLSTDVTGSTTGTNPDQSGKT